MRAARLAVVTAVMWVGTASADSTGDRLAGEAEQLAKDGKFVAAAAKFREAYAADQRPGRICNVGVAYKRAGDLPRAHLFLSRCLERGAALDGKYVEQVRKVVVDLEGALRAGDYTPIDVTVEPATAAVAIGGYAPDEGFVGGHLVWLHHGHHELVVSAEGWTTRTVPVDAAGHDVTGVHVVLERPAEPPPKLVEKPPPPSDPKPPPPVEVPVERHGRAPAIVATVATVGAAALAVVAYRTAHARQREAATALSTDFYDATTGSLDTWNLAFGASIGAAVVGTVASVWLWHRAGKPVHVRVEATGSSGAVSIGGAF